MLSIINIRQNTSWRVTDRHTHGKMDGQTYCDSIVRAVHTSRGKEPAAAMSALCSRDARLRVENKRFRDISDELSILVTVIM